MDTSISINTEIENYISENTISLEQIESWTFDELTFLFGVYSDTMFANVLSSITRQMRLDSECEMLGPFREAFADYYIDYDRKNEIVQVHLNGNPEEVIE